MQLESITPTSIIYIIRHGQSLHNIDHSYSHRDPPLTSAGEEATKEIVIPAVPDLIVVSPMTRTIQTAMNAFPSILGADRFQPEVQIWPDLREAHDANCNKGVSRAEITARFSQFNFAECPEEWNYPTHTIENATARAELVRRRLKEASKVYRNIALITHRGFIAFLVKGDRFALCEARSYCFSMDNEGNAPSSRMGINVDTKETQDFGPTVLVPYAAACKELGSEK